MIIAEIKQAIRNNNTEALKSLLPKNKYPYNSFDNILSYAAENGFLDIIKISLDYFGEECYQDTNIITGASKNAHIDIVRFLLNNHYYYAPHIKDAIFEATKNNHTEIVKLLFKKNNFKIDIQEAPMIVKNNNIELLNLFIEQNNKVLSTKIKNLTDIERMLIESMLENMNKGFLKAALLGFNDMIKEMLTMPLVMNNYKKDNVFSETIIYNNVDTLKLLLNSKWLDPSAFNNKAIILALKRKSFDTLSLLWKDERVKKSLKKNNPEIFERIKVIKNLEYF